MYQTHLEEAVQHKNEIQTYKYRYKLLKAINLASVYMKTTGIKRKCLPIYIIL